MKKTVTVNLNSIVFHIDEDAYNALQNYLTELSHHFTQEEGDEIMKDIEARIAELFSSKLSNIKSVVTIADVEEVITILGHPSDFDTDQDEVSGSKESEKKRRRKYRRFYRNPENVILGGVCSGLAAYMDWDAVVVRILFIIVLCVGFGWIIPIYLALWLLIPEARTAAQRLEMMGEEPSLENIKNFVESGRFKESANQIGSRLGEVLRWVIKLFFIVIGSAIVIVSFIVLFAIIIVFCSMFYIEPGTGLGSLAPEGISQIGIIAFIFSLAISIAIPLFAIIYSCIRMIRNDKQPRNKVSRWIIFCIWLIALFTTICLSFWGGKKLLPIAQSLEIEEFANENMNFVTEVRPVKDFDAIHAEGHIKVYLTQGSESTVSIEATEKALSNIKTQVTNGTLKIHYKKFYIGEIIKVYITTPHINEIVADKTCTLICDSTLNSDFLKIKSLSASHIDLNVSCNRIDIKNENTSYVQLKGKTDFLNLKCNNASTTNLNELTVRTGKIDINNAANLNFNVIDTLYLEASNCSQITYDSILVDKKITLQNSANMKKRLD